MKRKGLKRRVAVLFDAIEDDYQVGILRGAIHEAQLSNVELICFAGGVLGSGPSDLEHRRNFLFRIPTATTYDGLLVLSASLSNHVGPAFFCEWSKNLPRLPTVHIGLDVEGADSLIVDGGEAMYQLVRHLITEHNRRDIAFLRGPAKSQEAEARFVAYQRALVDSGIELDPKNVLQGTWLKDSGAEALRGALSERRSFLRGGALVSANDYMALGALEVLRAAGLVVPEDLLLTGFDDLDATRSADPPLTTVRQPTFRLGQEGMKRLLGRLGKAPAAPQVSSLPAQVVERFSCGCRARGSVLPKRPGAEARGSLRSELQRQTPLIVAELARAAKSAFHAVGPGWEDRLLGALVVDLTSDGLRTVRQTLDRMLLKLHLGPSEAEAFHAILTVLRESILELGVSDPAAVSRALGLLDGARQRVFDAALRDQLAHGQASLRFLRKVTEAVSCLRSAEPRETTHSAAELHLREAGLSAISVGAFAETGFERGELYTVVAYGERPRTTLPPKFPLAELAPAGADDFGSDVLLVQPLLFDHEPVGVLTTRFGPEDPLVYEQTRELLSIGVAGFQAL